MSGVHRCPALFIGATIWEPAAVYAAKTTKHLDAVKKFLAFVASPAGADAVVEPLLSRRLWVAPVPAGADAVTSVVAPPGPYRIEGAKLPADAMQIAKDLQAYIDNDATSPALEFLSPVKGPSLEQITVEVGSGIRKNRRAIRAGNVLLERHHPDAFQ